MLWASARLFKSVAKHLTHITLRNGTRRLSHHAVCKETILTSSCEIPSLHRARSSFPAGLSGDRDFRMMSYYFDHEAYQAQIAAAKAAAPVKRFKGTKKFWKDRKEAKRRAKLLADLKAD